MLNLVQTNKLNLWSNLVPGFKLINNKMAKPKSDIVKNRRFTKCKLLIANCSGKKKSISSIPIRFLWNFYGHSLFSIIRHLYEDYCIQTRVFVPHNSTHKKIRKKRKFYSNYLDYILFISSATDLNVLVVIIVIGSVLESRCCLKMVFQKLFVHINMWLVGRSVDWFGCLLCAAA